MYYAENMKPILLKMLSEGAHCDNWFEIFSLKIQEIFVV